MNGDERLRQLRQQRERINAELNAVEDGTLPFLEERTEATPQELAEAFRVTVQAANNRLVRLVEVGLVTREPYIRNRGGRGYRYRPAPAGPGPDEREGK